ncbi:Ig-like domain-containing protein [Mitsuaria sp. WAJ17]|uniref:Ig-like domain-containing protein n=1 Tax=Mitsuaria sp. WAJ17 TaxID=2761452 RepID=UPI0016019AB4|nr:Ig-like domain-containing protein [Mitsuaria sp. WAJ17]MBB2487215.1 Ig-like domain-containing protein [Mitsuaria sp. WAJ17]
MNQTTSRQRRLPLVLLLAGLLALGACGSGDTTVAPALQARDDSATVDNGGALLIDVLANDQGQGLVLDSVQPPGLGQASIEGGKIRYTPGTNALGQDRFTYQVHDAQGITQQATVSLTLRRELQLEGQVLLDGQGQPRRSLELLSGEQALASAQTDDKGSYRLQLWLSNSSQLDSLLRLRLKEDSGHPRDRAELYLASGSTLVALAGNARRLEAGRVSALKVDEWSIGEAALLLGQHRSLTQQDSLTDELALRHAVSGYSLDGMGDRTALVQAARQGLVPLPTGIATLAQLLADETGLRQFRAAAQATLGDTLERMRQDAQTALLARSPFTQDSLPARYILGPVGALDQAPVFSTAKNSALLTLQTGGTGQLRPRQSFAPAHGALRWEINGKGALLLSGSGTEQVAGTDIFDNPYHQYLQGLRRLGRFAFGDVLQLSVCTSEFDCGPEDGSAVQGEQLSLGLSDAPLPLQAAEVPGRWFLPIAETQELKAHTGAGPLLAMPLELRADGSITGRSWRWRLDGGELLVENGSSQRWRLQLMQRSAPRQFVMHALYEGPQGQGASLGEAYVQDPALSWQRSDLIGEWRINRLLRTLQLRADGSASLLTHHDAYQGSWTLAADGSLQLHLGNESADFVLQWWGLSSDKAGALVVEGGHALAKPDQAFASTPYRYERASP